MSGDAREPVVHVERLTLWAAIESLRAGLVREGIRYFDATPAGLRFALALHAAGVSSRPPERAAFILGQLLDEAGYSAYGRLQERAREIAVSAARDSMDEPFLSGFADMFDRDRVELYLAKLIEEDVAEAVVHIEVAAAHPGSGAIVLLRRRPWTGHLAAHAGERGVQVRTCRGWRARAPVCDAAIRVLAPLWRIVAVGRDAADRTARDERPPRAQATVPVQAGRREDPVLAVGYTGRTISFDPARRSELFWLEPGRVDGRHVLLYSNRPAPVLGPGQAAILAGGGVAAVATRRHAAARGLALHRPDVRDLLVAGRLIVTVVSLAVRCALSRRAPATPFLTAALRFCQKYAGWRGFFERNRVKLHLDMVNYEASGVARNLAVEDAGGVSVSYQWSNLSVASLFSAGTCDAFFAFGPAYDELFGAMGSRFGRTLYSGYVTDHSFRAVAAQAAELKSSLRSLGGELILAFFDENSADVPMSRMTNAELAEVYAALLRRVLADPGFALVVKPGYPLTLADRMASIARLWERAESTGRLALLASGDYLTDIYPAQAALASDVAVGLLGSGTVVLESYLAGKPSVFLNVGPRTSHDPLCVSGLGATVFDSVHELLDAADRFRADPESVPGFGDLGEWVRERDPFRDGRAAERVNGYLGWLLEGFASGLDREGVLAMADARYRAEWGEWSVRS